MNFLVYTFISILVLLGIMAGYLLICSGIVLIVVRLDRKKSGKKAGKVLNFFSFVNIPLGLVLMVGGWIYMTT